MIISQTRLAHLKFFRYNRQIRDRTHGKSGKGTVIQLAKGAPCLEGEHGWDDMAQTADHL